MGNELKNIEVSASSGDVSVRARYSDSGARFWEVQRGNGDFYTYTSRQGLKNPEHSEDLSVDNFNRTDTINFTHGGKRYTGDFCWYSADATIYDPKTDDVFMRSAPDYGTRPASEEFNEGWAKIRDAHKAVQAELSQNPDYLKAAAQVGRNLEEQGIKPSEFFDKPTNDALQADSQLGADREVPSSVFWKPELDTIQGNSPFPKPEIGAEVTSPAVERFREDAATVSAPMTPSSSPAPEMSPLELGR